MGKKKVSKEVKAQAVMSALKVASDMTNKKSGKASTNGKKKKKNSFLSLLGGATKAAVSLAPALLPLLLKGHAPTAALGAANPVMAAGVPLATAGTTANLVGLKSIKVTGNDSRGNVNKLVVTTMDLITDIPSTAFAKGDVLFECFLNPLDPVFEGTKFAQYGRMFEKYQVKSGAWIYEPSCPATTSGSIAGCTFADPTVDPENLGAQQLDAAVSGEPGADGWQPYAMGTFSVPPSRQLFTEPNGSDARLTIAGRTVVIASEAIVGGLAPGQLFLLAEVEYSSPTSVEIPGAGAAARFVSAEVIAAGGDTYQPVNAESVLTVDYHDISSGRYVTAQSAVVAAGVTLCNAVVGLPPGDYLVSIVSTGTVMAYPAYPEITATATSAGVVILGQDTIVNAGATTGVSRTILSVPSGVPDDQEDFVFFGSATTFTGTAIIIVRLPESMYVSALELRSALWGRTAQGVALKQRKFLAEVQTRMARLEKVTPDPLAALPASRAILASASTLPRHLSRQ